MNKELIHEINMLRNKPLAKSNLLNAQATASVLIMAENDDLSLMPSNGIAARGDIRPWQLAARWARSTRQIVLLDPKLTRIGVATCELNGVKYWCVLTN